jgi:DNA-binding MarR family transcriptional regulator
MNEQDLHALDDAIHGFRIATQRPSYRRFILDGLGFDGGVASVRVLRAVALLTTGDRGPSIGQVATELGVKHSTASRLIDGLVKDSLLAKVACGDDRRHARLSLTEQGDAILTQATARRRHIIQEATAEWDDQDVTRLAELLHRLSTNIDEQFAQS